MFWVKASEVPYWERSGLKRTGRTKWVILSSIAYLGGEERVLMVEMI